MSTLKRIRENVGLVIVLIAISLFAFIFTDLLNNIRGGADNTVAEINGESIEYPDLDAKTQFVERNQNQPASTPDEIAQMRAQAWQSFVQEVVYKEEWNSSGVGMSDEELKYMLTGRIYHPYVASSGFFTDSTGRYNPGIVDQVLAQADQFNLNDPALPENARRYKRGLLDLLEILRLDRQSNKWQKLITNSVIVTDNEVQRSSAADQQTASIAYVAVPYSSVPDESVTLADGDYAAYYDKYRERFKRNEADAKIKYTYFPVQPSPSDSSEARNNMSKIVEDFSKAKNVFEFALSNSDSRSLDTSLKPVQLLPEVILPVLDQPNKVVGPIVGENGISLYRIAKVGEDSANSSLNVRHILVKLAGPTPADSAAAKAKAQDILRRVNSSNFAEIAATDSEDPLTKDRGGNLGWVGSADLGPDFQEVMKDAPAGSFKIAQTAQGYHVLEVLNRTNKLYTVAEINRDIAVSTATKDSIFKRASGYHGKILSGGDFDETLVDYAEARTNTSGRLGPGEYNLLGLKGARPIITWAFKNDQGFINEEILESDDAFVVAKIISKGGKGYLSLEDVKEDIEPEVRNMKKAETIAAKLKSASGADMNAIAAAYGAGATAGTAADVRFSNNFVQNIGNEPKVVGRTFGLKQGEMSQPIKGNTGVYVIKVNSVSEVTPLEDMAITLQKQAIQQAKVQQAVNAAYQGMIDAADVRDMRYKFDY